jgi:hypothetical protein
MRKKSMHAKRPSFFDKSKDVLAAIKRLTYRQAQRTNLDFGFTMAQIAEEAGYARSQRFMETLYSMVDEGMLDKQEWPWSTGAVKTRCVFRIKATHKQKPMAYDFTFGDHTSLQGVNND